MTELAIYEKAAKVDKRYIVFNVGNETYGIDISCVNTIIQMPEITRVPNAPHSFSGVMNLRGEIISVMSLNKKINSVKDKYTKDSRVIVVELGDGNLMGLIVDSVKEVITVDGNDVEEPSPFLKKEESLVKGVAKVGDDIITIIEVASLLEREIA